VSRCRTCGRDIERVLSPPEVLRAAATILEIRARGAPYAAALCSSRLAWLQVIEALAGLLDRRDFVRQELARSVEVAELDDCSRRRRPGGRTVERGLAGDGAAGLTALNVLAKQAQPRRNGRE
jgi:hypothetical protein